MISNDSTVEWFKMPEKLRKIFERMAKGKRAIPPSIRIVLPLNYDETLRDVWEGKK